MHKLISPLFVDLPRKTKKDKRVYLNLNTYRNIHYIINNDAKTLYKELMRKQIEKLPKFNQIKVYCKLFRGTLVDGDKDNVISITKKFFFDALQELGRIPNDNDNHILDEHTYPSEYDKGNGRVEIMIESVNGSAGAVALSKT